MEEEKTWIVVLTHGDAGKELIKSAEMILGKLENVCAFSLLPGMLPEDFLLKVKLKLDKIPKGTLVLTDLYGGTPSNIIGALSKLYDVYVVTGVNIAMLIEGDVLRNSIQGDELAEQVRSIGSDACKKLTF